MREYFPSVRRGELLTLLGADGGQGSIWRALDHSRPGNRKNRRTSGPVGAPFALSASLVALHFGASTCSQPAASVVASRPRPPAANQKLLHLILAFCAVVRRRACVLRLFSTTRSRVNINCVSRSSSRSLSWSWSSIGSYTRESRNCDGLHAMACRPSCAAGRVQKSGEVSHDMCSKSEQPCTIPPLLPEQLYHQSNRNPTHPKHFPMCSCSVPPQRYSGVYK